MTGKRDPESAFWFGAIATVALALAIAALIFALMGGDDEPTPWVGCERHSYVVDMFGTPYTVEHTRCPVTPIP